MKFLLLCLGLVTSALAFIPTQASAYVCARGVYRAGCAGPNGAVVRHRGAYVAPRGVYVAPRPVYVAPRPVYVAPRPVYVAPACRWIDGVRYCR
jgi:hypothetical protein